METPIGQRGRCPPKICYNGATVYQCPPNLQTKIFLLKKRLSLFESKLSEKSLCPPKNCKTAKWKNSHQKKISGALCPWARHGFQGGLGFNSAHPEIHDSIFTTHIHDSIFATRFLWLDIHDSRLATRCLLTLVILCLDKTTSLKERNIRHLARLLTVGGHFAYEKWGGPLLFPENWGDQIFKVGGSWPPTFNGGAALGYAPPNIKTSLHPCHTSTVR